MRRRDRYSDSTCCLLIFTPLSLSLTFSFFFYSSQLYVASLSLSRSTLSLSHSLDEKCSNDPFCAVVVKADDYLDEREEKKTCKQEGGRGKQEREDNEEQCNFPLHHCVFSIDLLSKRQEVSERYKRTHTLTHRSEQIVSQDQPRESGTLSLLWPRASFIRQNQPSQTSKIRSRQDCFTLHCCLTYLSFMTWRREE